MRKSVILVISLLLLGVVGVFVMSALRSEPERRPPPVQTPLVQTVSVDSRTGPLFVAGTGTVRPRAEITLAPQVAGRVVYVHPSLVSGGRVYRGQELIRIEQADYQNALRQAEAEVAQQKVGLMQAEEESALARDEYERFRAREASRQQISPLATIDSNDYAEGLTETAENTTSGDASAEPSSLVLREPQRAAAEAALSRAEAMQEDAELALSRTRIRAPFDGYVRTESVDEGQFVAVGQALAQLYASDAFEVIVPLSSESASLIPGLWSRQAGSSGSLPASVYMKYGGTSYQWPAFVHRAEAALNTATRTIDVVVRVPRPFEGGTPVEVEGEVNLIAPQAPPLLVGQYTSVEIEGMELERHFIIPRSALRIGDEVWVVENDSLVNIVPVQVIQKVDEDVYVLGDLPESVDVITTDMNVATQGMKVRVSRD